MKRCPQCDFLYEDEQSVCDMDGNALVVADSTLPRSATKVEMPAPKSRRLSNIKLFGILTIPIVALAVIFAVVFQSSSAEGVSESKPDVAANNNLQPVASPEAFASPLPSPVPTEQPSPPDEKSLEDARKAVNANLHSMARADADSIARVNSKAIGNTRAKSGGMKMVVVSSRKSGAFATQDVSAGRKETQKAPTETKAGTSDGKKNKLGSLLKTTGRILKKPFKL